MHTSFHGPLLTELYNLISDKSQLWIATHSIGMIRKAYDIYRENSESVVFLDFNNRDLDEPIILKPVLPNSNFWRNNYKIALGDISELITPKQIVFCEGESFDAACYNQIFNRYHPDTLFISIGGRKNMKNPNTTQNLIPIIEKITVNAEIIRLQDKDDATDGAIERDKKDNIRTLSRRTIESYLIDDEVLTKLCKSEGKLDLKEKLLEKKKGWENDKKLRNNPKGISQKVHGFAREKFQSLMGNECYDFLVDIIAPLIQPDMKVYKELERDIFGK